MMFILCLDGSGDGVWMEYIVRRVKVNNSLLMRRIIIVMGLLEVYSLKIL